MVTECIQNFKDKKTEKSIDTVKEETKIESNENLKLCNEENKLITSVDIEDLNARNVEQTRAYVLSGTDEAVVVADTCTIAAPICDQTVIEK